MHTAASAPAFPSYPDFAHRLHETGMLTDAWLDGEPRFRLHGVTLSPSRARALQVAVERIGAMRVIALDAGAQRCQRDLHQRRLGRFEPPAVHDQQTAISRCTHPLQHPCA